MLRSHREFSPRLAQEFEHNSSIAGQLRVGTSFCQLAYSVSVDLSGRMRRLRGLASMSVRLSEKTSSDVWSSAPAKSKSLGMFMSSASPEGLPSVVQGEHTVWEDVGSMRHCI
jgi:hypothetical protein